MTSRPRRSKRMKPLRERLPDGREADRGRVLTHGEAKWENTPPARIRSAVLADKSRLRLAYRQHNVLDERRRFGRSLTAARAAEAAVEIIESLETALECFWSVARGFWRRGIDSVV